MGGGDFNTSENLIGGLFWFGKKMLSSICTASVFGQTLSPLCLQLCNMRWMKKGGDIFAKTNDWDERDWDTSDCLSSCMYTITVITELGITEGA